MTRGRPRKPTALKIVDGTFRKDRANANEPRPDRKRLPSPPHLDAGARKIWRGYAKLLDDMGVLTVADRTALECLVMAHVDLTAARQALAARDGLTYECYTKTGVTIRLYPEVRLVNDATKRLHSWLSAFGITPADRNKVETRIEKNEDPAAKFLR
jgi:P27 family predicted phage terminase small subunit